MKTIALLSQILSGIAALSAYANIIPAKYAPLATLAFIIAATLKDIIIHIGDYLDDGQMNDSYKPPTSSASGTSKPGGPLLLVAISVMLAGILFCGTGCHSTPQTVTYQAVGTSAVTVEAALHAYDVFAAQGKTTPAMNAQVKAAYAKYQAAFALVCDAGAVYAATSNTNAPAASQALQQAILNANTTIADLVNLVRSFGVKI